MTDYNYRSISNFGKIKNPADNPLSYCLESGLYSEFLHGASSSQITAYSRPCQEYMAQYCAQGWDGFCDLGLANTDPTESYYPNTLNQYGGGTGGRLNQGEIMLVNTASYKYLVDMVGGHKKVVPFDYNVADSPAITVWCDSQGSPWNPSATCHGCSRNCTAVPVYAVDPSTIDDDPVMNRLLLKPSIAPLLFTNIYNTMKRFGTLPLLKGTKLGKFFDESPYFMRLGGI